MSATHPSRAAQRLRCRDTYIVRRGMRAAGGGPAPPGRAGGHVCAAGVGRPRNDRRKRASDCVRSGAHGGATAARHDGALRRRPRRWDSQSGGFASAARSPSRFHVAAALEPRRFLLELSPTGRSWLEKGRSRYDGGGLGGASRHVSNAQWMRGGCRQPVMEVDGWMDEWLALRSSPRTSGGWYSSGCPNRRVRVVSEATVLLATVVMQLCMRGGSAFSFVWPA